MRKVADKIMEIVFLVLACVSIVAVVIVCYFMFSRGIPAIRQIGLGEFITGKIWKPTYDYFGILPMIVGSLMVNSRGVSYRRAGGNLYGSVHGEVLSPDYI